MLRTNVLRTVLSVLRTVSVKDKSFVSSKKQIGGNMKKKLMDGVEWNNADGLREGVPKSQIRGGDGDCCGWC